MILATSALSTCGRGHRLLVKTCSLYYWSKFFTMNYNKLGCVYRKYQTISFAIFLCYEGAYFSYLYYLSMFQLNEEINHRGYFVSKCKWCNMGNIHLIIDPLGQLKSIGGEQYLEWKNIHLQWWCNFWKIIL